MWIVIRPAQRLKLYIYCFGNILINCLIVVDFSRDFLFKHLIGFNVEYLLKTMAIIIEMIFMCCPLIVLKIKLSNNGLSLARYKSMRVNWLKYLILWSSFPLNIDRKKEKEKMPENVVAFFNSHVTLIGSEKY